MPHLPATHSKLHSQSGKEYSELLWNEKLTHACKKSHASRQSLCIGKLDAASCVTEISHYNTLVSFVVPGYGFQFLQSYFPSLSKNWQDGLINHQHLIFLSYTNRNRHKLTHKMDDNLICMQTKEINLTSDFLSLQVIFNTNDN